ncbi:Na+/H+ antiporter NhaC [Halanaerobaculum tunisiense]
MTKKNPSIISALMIVGVSISILSYGILQLDVAPHIPLLLSSSLVALFAVFKLDYSWSEIEDFILEGINIGLSSILILMVIGTVIGTWILSGSVQTMIYYGLQLLTPQSFLVVTVLVCAIVSLATGSSWTTVGTIGVALIGIAEGLEIPLPIATGAIVSGAFFGDKMSPLSDTTNLAPAVAGSKLFEHIKHMFFTVTPSLLISLGLYIIIGLQYSGQQLNQDKINLILTNLQQEFYLGPILLLPPVIVIMLALKKKPALPTLLLSALLGGLFGFLFQEATLQQVLSTMHYGYQSDTGIEMVDQLLTRGGLQDMLWSVSLVIIALSLGGLLEKVGFLEVILDRLSRLTTNRGGLVVTTVFTCLGVNILLADQYLSIMLPGRMYAQSYRELNLHPKNLSRSLEDSGTLFNALIPWGLSGSFIFSTLGVSPLEYAPYAFLCLLTPLISIFYGYTGFTMEELD